MGGAISSSKVGRRGKPKITPWNYDRNLTGIITRRHWVYHGLHLIYSHIVSLSLKLCSWAGWKPMLYCIYIYTHVMHDYTDGYTSDIQPAWGYVPLGECLNITFAHLFVRVRYSSAILILVLVLLVESFFFLISPDFSWLNGYGSIWLYDQYLKHRLEMKNQGKSRRNTIPYD